MSFSSYTSSKLSTLHRRFCGERLVMRVGVGGQKLDRSSCKLSYSHIFYEKGFMYIRCWG